MCVVHLLYMCVHMSILMYTYGLMSHVLFAFAHAAYMRVTRVSYTCAIKVVGDLYHTMSTSINSELCDEKIIKNQACTCSNILEYKSA